jgi:hypothetical protein
MSHELVFTGTIVNPEWMPTGQGHHFISVSAALRKKLGKGVGDEVEVRITRRVG